MNLYVWNYSVELRVFMYISNIEDIKNLMMKKIWSFKLQTDTLTNRLVL